MDPELFTALVDAYPWVADIPEDWLRKGDLELVAMDFDEIIASSSLLQSYYGLRTGAFYASSTPEERQATHYTYVTKAGLIPEFAVLPQWHNPDVAEHWRKGFLIGSVLQTEHTRRSPNDSRTYVTSDESEPQREGEGQAPTLATLEYLVATGHGRENVRSLVTLFVAPVLEKYKAARPGTYLPYVPRPEGMLLGRPDPPDHLVEVDGELYTDAGVTYSSYRRVQEGLVQLDEYFAQARAGVLNPWDDNARSKLLFAGVHLHGILGIAKDAVPQDSAGNDTMWQGRMLSQETQKGMAYFMTVLGQKSDEAGATAAELHQYLVGARAEALVEDLRPDLRASNDMDEQLRLVWPRASLEAKHFTEFVISMIEIANALQHSGNEKPSGGHAASAATDSTVTTQVCPACGKENSRSAKFCFDCGGALIRPSSEL